MPLGALEGFLEALWALLGRLEGSWAVSGRVCVLEGGFEAIFFGFWIDFGRIWDRFGEDLG